MAREKEKRKERKKKSPDDNGNLSVDSRVGDNYRFMDVGSNGGRIHDES